MLKWSYSLQQNKDQIRKILLSKRSAMTAMQRKMAGQAALLRLIAAPFFLASQQVACYIGREEEFDCHPIIQKIWQLGKKCYLPILSPPKDHNLEFVLYSPDDPLRLNRYKIFEPANGERIAAEHLELVIVPLVGFDIQGHRIGMGGGYYDRTFAFKREAHVTKPFLLGLGYEVQKVAKVPDNSWDVKLDGILTEESLYLSL